MQSLGLSIGFFSLFESLAKIVLSELILGWQSKYLECSDNVTLCWTEKLYALVGFFGFWCSLKLIIGVKTKTAKHLLCWLVFQWCSLIYQIYMSVVMSDLIAKSEELQLYSSVASLAIFIYTLLELYFLFTIIRLYVSYRQSENVSEDPEQQSTQFHLKDNPPSYEEAIKIPR